MKRHSVPRCLLASSVLAAAAAAAEPQEVKTPEPELAPLTNLVWRLPAKYATLDRLEAAGAIAIASPMEVNACLIGFFLYGRLALRERTTALQNAAFAMGLLGVVLIALG